MGGVRGRVLWNLEFCRVRVAELSGVNTFRREGRGSLSFSETKDGAVLLCRVGTRGKTETEVAETPCLNF